MTVSFLNKIPRIVMYVLIGITAVVAGLFYMGAGYEVSYNNTTYFVPVYINLLMIWTYILLGLAILSTLAFVIVKFVLNTIKSPKSAIKPLCLLAGGVLLFVIAYALGDGTPLNISGYEGTQNVYKWLKITDMFLFVTYALFLAAFGAIALSNVAKYFK